MKNKNQAFAVAVIPALAFQGCAGSVLNRKIDNEVVQESAIKTHAELRNEAGQLIQTAPGLTSEQRSKLSALREAANASWMNFSKVAAMETTTKGHD